MAIQNRRGLESDFDPSKMLPGEWAVSTDTKYVRMCFAPGIVLRMATYESFEMDKAQIKDILENCKTIEAAIIRIQTEVNKKANITVEYAKNASNAANKAEEYARSAKAYADNASAVTGVKIATKDRAGLVKGGENSIAEDGTLELAKVTTDRVLTNSYASNLKINKIEGASEQYKGIGKNYLNNTASSITENGITVTVNDDKSITVNGTPTITTDINVGSATLEAGDYILSGNVVMSGDSSEIPYIFISIEYNDGEMGAVSLKGAEQRTISFKLDVTVEYHIMLRANYALENITFYPMISIGGGEYEPYMVYPNPEYPEPIESVGDGGSLEIITQTNNLYSGGNQTFTRRVAIELEKPLQPGTYTVSAFVESTDTDSTLSALGFVGGATTGGQRYVQLTRGERVSSTQTIYNPVSTIWLLASDSYDNGAGDTATWSDIQIEARDTATPYQPYKYDSITIPLSEPLRKYDKIVKQDGVWGIKRGTKSVPFSGTWKIRPEVAPSDGSICYSSADFISDNVAKADMYMACTHLTFGGTITGIADVEPLGKVNNFYKFYKDGTASGAGTTMYVCSNETTLDDFLAKMEGSEFEYELATPVFEPFDTDTQFALNSLMTYDRATNVSTNSEVEPVIEFEYATSLVGKIALEAVTIASRNEILINELRTLTNSISTAMVEREE